MVDRIRLDRAMIGVRRSLHTRPAVGGVIAVAALAGLISWLVIRGGVHSTSEGTTPPAPTPPQPGRTYSPIGPISLAATGLKPVVASLGQPVYWAGPKPGKRYGLTRNAKGDVFLRYLPAGVKAGAERRLLTVGTYRFRGAYAATKALTGRLGAISTTLDDGGFVYYRADHPVSVYLVYPNLNYQIEVYSPAPMEARHIVLLGDVRPVR